MDSSQGDTSRTGSKHHWSYSKSRDFDACPLKIYFQDKQSTDASQAEDTSSQPINLHAIVGVAVHHGIASQIDEWADGGNPTYWGAKQEAENWIDDVWEDRYERIIEANNGEHLPDGQRQKFVGITKRHLRTFFKAIWPEFRGHEHVLHEEFRQFEVRGHPVYGKVDLCTRDQDGNLVITDWKTSEPALLEFESLQLNVYGLWARECMESDVSKIKIQFGHIKTGGTPSHSLNPEELDTVAERIDRECQQWNDRDGIDDFSADPEPEKCRGCQFLKRCEAGQSVIE